MSVNTTRLISGVGAEARETTSKDDAEYSAELQFLFGRLNYERAPERARSVADFRLDRMRELLGRLDNPQRQLPCIHIAGSKGKGSVATMIARVLEDSGLNVGLFTSPHVAEYGERMTVNGALPDRETLVPLMRQLRTVALLMDAESTEGRPTFFELTTALGWMYFREVAVDYVVLEVGLGGRLDSTNLCSPLVSVITSISFDHMRLLGDTLPQIAQEKAGIIKRCVPVVSGATAPEVREVIRQQAHRVGAPLIESVVDFTITEQGFNAASGLPLPRFSASGSGGDWENLQLGMPGRHQIRNASVALAVVSELRRSGLRIAESAVRSGLRRARIACRIEILGQAPLMIVDAAHNPASVQALCDTLSVVPRQKRVVIFGASRDKDAASMLQILNSFADHLVLTRYLNNPRAIDLQELDELAATTSTIPRTMASDPMAALNAARQLVSPADLIATTGSLFLAAEIRELLIQESAECPPAPASPSATEH